MDELTEDKLDDVKEESVEPLEVKIVNETKEKSTVYDDKDDEENDSIPITEEQIKEFEDGDSR